MSSEDPTQDIGQKYDTKPTIDTLLETLNEMRAMVEAQFGRMEVEVRSIKSDVRNILVALDRFGAVAHEARGEVRDLEGRVEALENK